jgi:hypothetical protein
MALVASSPAIDHADPADFPGADQRGFMRPCGAGPDIGACEFGSTLPGRPYLSTCTSGNNLVLSFPAFPSNLYRLQWSTNLAAWADLCTNGPVTSSMTVTQTVGKLDFSRWYLRLLVH